MSTCQYILSGTEWANNGTRFTYIDFAHFRAGLFSLSLFGCFFIFLVLDGFSYFINAGRQYRSRQLILTCFMPRFAFKNTRARTREQRGHENKEDMSETRESHETRETREQQLCQQPTLQSTYLANIFFFDTNAWALAQYICNFLNAPANVNRPPSHHGPRRHRGARPIVSTERPSTVIVPFWRDWTISWSFRLRRRPCPCPFHRTNCHRLRHCCPRRRPRRLGQIF